MTALPPGEEGGEAQQVAVLLQPADDQEYAVELGRSLVGGDASGGEDEDDAQQQADDVFASFRYEFQPASVDKSAPGLVSVDESNSVHVLMGSSTGAAGGVSFKGKLAENKETDCLLLFDGTKFRLEKSPFSCMQLRHVRAPTPRQRVKAQLEADGVGTTDTTASAAPGRAKAKPARKPVTGKRPVGRPKLSAAAKKARKGG